MYASGLQGQIANGNNGDMMFNTDNSTFQTSHVNPAIKPLEREYTVHR
jgi:hypothetical protein